MTGFDLKLIAMAAMVIDHVGAFFFPDQIIFRMVGRMSYPLFAFLIAESCRKTHHMKRFVLRLGLFALISEIPFDLALTGRLIGPGLLFQNVFVTFFFTVAGIALYERYSHLEWRFVFLAGGCLLASVTKGDYGLYGAVLLVAFYLYGHSSKAAVGFLVGLTILMEMPGVMGGGQSITLWSTLQLWCLTSAPMILLYNGRRGRDMRYLFYAFYPGHLLLLYLLRLLLL